MELLAHLDDPIRALEQGSGATFNHAVVTVMPTVARCKLRQPSKKSQRPIQPPSTTIVCPLI